MSKGKTVGEPSSESSNWSYCKRLAELVFPVTVWIEGKGYSEPALKARLEEDEPLLERLVELCFLKERTPAASEEAQKTWMVAEVLEKLFPKIVRVAGQTFRKRPTEEKEDVFKALLNDPQLQQHFAAWRYYMPSKWLVEQERIARLGEVWDGDIYEEVAREKLTGVCFSGGGIRSATFNLGVLQGLAQLGLLPHIDYLSSVSGGGYIHEFVAAWILRNGNQRSVVKELIPQAEPGCLPRSPEPIQWLKRYASYLTPARGIFSADSWTMLAIWFRNMVLNQIPILASFGFGLFLVHLLAPRPISDVWTMKGADVSPVAWRVTGLMMLGLAVWSLWKLWRNLELQESRAAAEEADSARQLLANSGVVTWLILPWLSCAVWMSYWVEICPGWAPGWFKLPILVVWGLMLLLVEIVIFKGGAVEAWEALNLVSDEDWEECRLRRNILAGMKQRLREKNAELRRLQTEISIARKERTKTEDELSEEVSRVNRLKEKLDAEVKELSKATWGLRRDLLTWKWPWKRAIAVVLFFLGGMLATAIACAAGWGLVWASEHFAPWLAENVGAVGSKAGEAQQLWKFSLSGVLHDFKANVNGSISGGASASDGVRMDAWRVEITLLPMLLLSVPYIAIELTLGLLGRDFRDMGREWLARLRAWSLLYGLLWAGVVGLTLLGPYVGYWVGTFSATGKWSTLIGFVAAHLTTVLGGASAKGDGKPTDKGILGYHPVDLLALIAAPFAMVSLLLLLSYCASRGVDALTFWLAQCPLAFVAKWNSFLTADVACMVAMLAIAALMGLRVDINEFSMHTFYKNRLSRCYLGAVVPGKRQPDPFTGFDGRGSVKYDGKVHNLPPFVTELLPKKYWRVDDKTQKGSYDGPFPIFCTTLNLTTGEDLATQERKGTSFAFTPLYSGYSVGWTDGTDKKVSFNGYVPTDTYAYPRGPDKSHGGIHLDSAVAISGAAANPNMGYNTNPALAFLMTLFNVRLGWWIANPRRKDMWQVGKGRATPRVALFSLLQELFGAVGDDAAFVNLSDGGHFENMGLYELVRRRCRFIVVCDAEEDADMSFGGMGMAITKCRADFGAEIDLDLRPLRIDPATGYSKTHCVVGTIQYPPPWASRVDSADLRTECGCLEAEVDNPFSGVIVYMKSSLVGDEPADLLTYRLKSPAFPQDSTANQWFTESKFEAYRRLGHHVAMTTIKPALPPMDTEIRERGQVETLFERMYALWYPRTPEMEKYLGDHLKQYEAILRELRERKELVGLEAALTDPRPATDVPVVAWSARGGDPQSLLYPGQFASSLLDFMYTVYTNLVLAFPDNRVSPHAEWWICLFRRWCRVTLVQDAWRSHAPMYSVEFRLFARRELRLPGVAGVIE